MKTPHDQIAGKPAHPAPLTLDDLLARAVADKLEQSPYRASLLRVPISNIDRWLNQRVVSAPQQFRRWRELLEQACQTEMALQRVLEILRSDSDDARHLRDFSPFAGVLTSEERRAILRQCSYSH